MSTINKIDLTYDLSDLTDNLLVDIKSATDQIKNAKQNERKQKIKAAEKAKSRKNSAVIIAVATIVILLLAYFLVFAKPDDNSAYLTKSASAVSVNTPIQNPAAVSAPIQSQVPSTTPAPIGKDSQPANTGSDDEIEQPGM